MVNEEILGGIEAALLRGQSLRQAMISFYNAGYKKEEIEEAAKYSRQALHINPDEKMAPQKTKIVPKSIKKQEKKVIVEQKPIGEKKEIDVTKKQEIKPLPKKIGKKLKPTRKISVYGEDKGGETHELKSMLKKTIRQLKKIRTPLKTQAAYSKEVGAPPQGSQRVSNYVAAPKPVNKVVTFLLVFLLIFLLGALAAVFFFRQELIDLFNRINIS